MSPPPSDHQRYKKKGPVKTENSRVIRAEQGTEDDVLTYQVVSRIAKNLCHCEAGSKCAILLVGVVCVRYFHQTPYQN
jgi:hypothetical protein